MTMTALKQKARGIFSKIEKFKYAVLILALGILLMLIPVKDKPQEVPVQKGELSADPPFSEKLEDILSTIDGAGQTKVLLTLETGGTSIFQTDLQLEQTENIRKEDSKTVLLSSGSGTEDALIKETVYPSYRGALVVCEGADSAAVRLRMIQAVSSLTGLTSDKITVIKMSSD